MPDPGSAGALVDDITARLRPLEIELAEAWWESNTRSSPGAEQRRIAAELARQALFADAELFARIREARRPPPRSTATIPCCAASSTCCTTRSCRTRCPKPSGARSSSWRRASRRPSTRSAARSTAAASTTTPSTRSCARATTATSGRAAWEASKQIGREVAEPLRELARLRNGPPATLGFRDHFALALATAELDEDRLFATLDDVDRATATPFAAWKHDLDAALAARFGVAVDELRPWHLDDPFFQETPSAGAIALDHLFADADLEALTRAHLRRPRSRRAAGARAQRPLRARRQEPARVLHRHRPRGRRARAVQRRAERALDGHDAPRVRPRDLRPRDRPRRSPGCCAARRTR